MMFPAPRRSVFARPLIAGLALLLLLAPAVPSDGHAQQATSGPLLFNGESAPPSAPSHAPIGTKPGPAPRSSAPDAKGAVNTAKAAFRAFTNAETPEELTDTITRTTAFEFGAILMLEVAALRRGMAGPAKDLVEDDAQSYVGKELTRVMKKYKPEETPTSDEERYRKMKENGYSFFLDMVTVSNTMAEKLGTPPHVDVTHFLENIPGETHWTFEKVSDSKVNVVLTGDRVEVGEHSFLMSRPPVVVKTNGAWKVQITGVSRFSLAPSSGKRLHLTEPLSIGASPFDTYFQNPSSLPVAAPFADRRSGATTRAGAAIVTLSELDVSYADGRLVPDVELRAFLPAFPHLGIPKNAFRKYNGALSIDQVTDQKGNTYSSGFWDEEKTFTYDSRFATPDGIGPAMEAEYNQELKEEGLAPSALSKISGSVTFFFPINAQKSTVPVSELTEQTALTAGKVEVQLQKQSDQKFTVVWPREKRDLILRLYGLTKSGEVLPLDQQSADFESGYFTSTVETKKPIQKIGLCAGSAVYEKTLPFELDVTVRRASIPLFEPGATETLGGSSFEVANSIYDEKAKQTHIFLRQSGPVTDGRIGGFHYAGVEEPSVGSRAATFGYNRFLRYEKKPKRLLLYLIQ